MIRNLVENTDRFIRYIRIVQGIDRFVRCDCTIITGCMVRISIATLSSNFETSTYYICIILYFIFLMKLKKVEINNVISKFL